MNKLMKALTVGMAVCGTIIFATGCSSNNLLTNNTMQNEIHNIGEDVQLNIGNMMEEDLDNNANLESEEGNDAASGEDYGLDALVEEGQNKQEPDVQEPEIVKDAAVQEAEDLTKEAQELEKKLKDKVKNQN